MESVELDAKIVKQTVEMKLQQNDIKGAIIFAKRVQSLFPELRRLFQFLGNLVVHVSGEEEELDWYSVLGVNPSADSKTLQRCYVELATSGLDSHEAYKILDKAWIILSSDFSREAYDLRRRSRLMRQNAFIGQEATSATKNFSKGFSNVDSAVFSHQKRSRNDCNTRGRDQRSGYAVTKDPGPQLISPCQNLQANYAPRPSNIFWSNKMNIQPVMHNVSGESGSGVNLPPSAAIEVPSRAQVNYPCPNFHASNPLRPSNSLRPDIMNNQPNTYNVPGGCGSGQTLVSSSATVPNPNSKAKFAPRPPNTFWSGKINAQHGLYNALGEYGNNQTVVSSSVIVPSIPVISPCLNSQASSAPPPTNIFLSNKMNIQPGMHNISGERGSFQKVASSTKELVKPSSVNSKGGYEEGDQTSASRGKAPCIYSSKSGIDLSFVVESIGNGSVKHNKGKSSVYNIHDSSKNVPRTDMTAAIGVDGQKGVYQRDMGNHQGERISVSGSSRSNSRNILPDLEKTSLLVGRAKTEIFKRMDMWIAAGWKKECSAMHSIKNATARDSAQEGLMTMEVPDSDFHDFDKERTLKSFGENQVWAVYDDDDGMPRLYALVHKVLSKRTFKLEISWLNSKSNKELGPLNWIDSGFQKTCGEFWVGKKQVNCMLNSFSHRVLGWTKSARAYQIFPKKGDVWALYRNWSPKWNEHTTKEEKHKYDMVEVLEDYNEGKGVTIVPLVKVAGFKSVFYQHLDAKEVRTIPKEEMFRFSHQVISYLLTDQEAPNVPKGSKELDPAALPLELLQV